MQTLSIDIETYSDVNLSKCGVYGLSMQILNGCVYPDISVILE